MIEITNEAIAKLIQKTQNKSNTIRIGVTGGGCAGYEYIFDYESTILAEDNVYNFGKFNIVINNESLPFLSDVTLDYITLGLNESFKIINPAEKSACGCGVSAQF